MQDEPRLYVAPEPGFPLIPDRLLTMSDGQAHYLGHVLRRSVGDTVRLFNGHDGEWQASIETLRKDRGSFRVRAQRRPAAPETGPVLVFAPLKRDATDLVVRMATELGVSALLPVTTARTNTARVNRDRWIAIATEAAEQCERLTVPEIAEPVRFNDLLGSWPPGRPLLAAIERLAVPAPPSVASWRSANPALEPGLLIGPEGGFSPDELDALHRRPFVVAMTLGPRILRAETAALAGLAALQT